jgi:hypothetical protein
VIRTYLQVAYYQWLIVHSRAKSEHLKRKILSRTRKLAMHTLEIIALGAALLALCLLVGRMIGVSKGMATSALIFIPLWLVGAGVNLYIGVKTAGYSVVEELPVFLVVFAVPAIIALGVRWRLR